MTEQTTTDADRIVQVVAPTEHLVAVFDDDEQRVQAWGLTADGRVRALCLNDRTGELAPAADCHDFVAVHDLAAYTRREGGL